MFPYTFCGVNNAFRDDFDYTIYIYVTLIVT